MGRTKRYTPARLHKAAERYFTSITRLREVTEPVDSGRKDEKGHVIYNLVPVISQAGAPVIELEYIVPPTVGGLCRCLGISRSTWANYCDPKEHPEMQAVTEKIRDRLLEWNERELLTRQGKDVRGILFNLQNNYGYADKRELELGPQAQTAIQGTLTVREKMDLLREIAEDFQSYDESEE